MAERLNLFMIGQADFGLKSMGALANHNIVGVLAPPGRNLAKNIAGDPMRNAAIDIGMPNFGFLHMKEPDFPRKIKELGTDLVVMVYVSRIIPDGVLNAGRLRLAIQYHNSLLPEFRGGDAGIWPLYDGRDETGLTIFEPNEVVDGGRVMLQRRVPIGPEETQAKLYFNKLSPLGIEAIVESVDLIAAGTAKFTEQDESGRTLEYERLFEEKDGYVDLKGRSAKDEFNRIRAADSTPGAALVYKGNKLTVHDASLMSRVNGLPGDVVNVSEHGILIAANDGSILIRRVRRGGETRKIQAHESGIRVGDRLESLAA